MTRVLPSFVILALCLQSPTASVPQAMVKRTLINVYMYGGVGTCTVYMYMYMYGVGTV